MKCPSVLELGLVGEAVAVEHETAHADPASRPFDYGLRDAQAMPVTSTNCSSGTRPPPSPRVWPATACSGHTAAQIASYQR